MAVHQRRGGHRWIDGGAGAFPPCAGQVDARGLKPRARSEPSPPARAASGRLSLRRQPWLVTSRRVHSPGVDRATWVVETDYLAVAASLAARADSTSVNTTGPDPSMVDPMARSTGPVDARALKDPVGGRLPHRFWSASRVSLGSPHTVTARPPMAVDGMPDPCRRTCGRAWPKTVRMSLSAISPNDHPGERRGPASNRPSPPSIRSYSVSRGWTWPSPEWSLGTWSRVAEVSRPARG